LPHLRAQEILNDIIEITPNQITFNSFSIENNEIEIFANIRAVSSLTTFLNALKEYPQISTVAVRSIQNQPETNSVVVTINAKLKGTADENNL
jgi:hypothetical protein